MTQETDSLRVTKRTQWGSCSIVLATYTSMLICTDLFYNQPRGHWFDSLVCCSINPLSWLRQLMTVPHLIQVQALPPDNHIHWLKKPEESFECALESITDHFDLWEMGVAFDTQLRCAPHQVLCTPKETSRNRCGELSRRHRCWPRHLQLLVERGTISCIEQSQYTTIFNYHEK